MGEGRCRCCCVTYQTRVILFAVTNVFLTAVQLFLPLISSSFILYFSATKQSFQAKYVLHEETMSIFQRIPAIVLRPPDSSKISVEHVGMPHSALQSDLHVWASWVFVKVIMLSYSVVLYTGARKKSYGLVVSWFALNVPMALHSAMLLGMDVALGLLWRKPLNFQIFQGVLVGYNFLGLLFVYFFLRRIQYNRGVRYPEFKRGEQMDGKYRDPNSGQFRDPASLHL